MHRNLYERGVLLVTRMVILSGIVSFREQRAVLLRLVILLKQVVSGGVKFKAYFTPVPLDFCPRRYNSYSK